MPKVTSRRVAKPSKIVSKNYTKKYSIKGDQPLRTATAVTTMIPTKVSSAKLDYDIAVEEQVQSSLKRDLIAVEQSMVNERNRYQVVNKKFVRGESQLINDPQNQNYSMLKRQKEQLQRQQGASNDRLFKLQGKKTFSVDPVESAAISFNKISGKNPMRSGKNYVMTMPESSVASPGPLGNLGSAFKDVYAGVQNLVPSVPEASAAMPGTGYLIKTGKVMSGVFAKGKTAGDSRMLKKIMKAERIKAERAAIKAGATPNEAKQAGIDAAAVTKSIVGEQKGYLSKANEVPSSKIAFIKRPPKSVKIGDPIGALTMPEVALKERHATEVLAWMQQKKINPLKKGSGRYYDANTAKKWVATGTVLGTSTMPLHAAYGEPVSFGHDFYKGFVQKKVKPKKRPKKKGKH